jgi:signal recognition particle receptor subunit alpha
MTFVDQRLGTFQQMTALIKDALELALRQILTPKSSIDIFVDMAMAKSRGVPYTIAFIGVNGVGKSTNLSKVCFWALKKQFKVLIVACDTFRSGAVEQLKTHVKALSALNQGSVNLYERGYGKDASTIAKEALQYAKNNGHDLVLIDTAGRMQDNEPLMRALGKLIAENQPDKVIFVGEALVGSEAVDQLTKFNKALLDYSGTNMKKPRKIDGIILSKLDTIDDKVGAALSMSYTAHAPILFVGTGQLYGDLKTMNVKSLVATLLSP